MLLQDEQEIIVSFGKKLIESGLVKSTGGNLSMCNQEKDLVAIAPTRVAYQEMVPRDIVVLDLNGNQMDGDLKLSSEVSFHPGLINLRKDVCAVVYSHSPSTTTIACLGWALPAIYFLIGFVGSIVPVAP